MEMLGLVPAAPRPQHVSLSVQRGQLDLMAS